MGREVLCFTSALNVDGQRFCTRVKISEKALRDGANVARSIVAEFVVACPAVDAR